jgi:hypothetical protein
MAEKNHVDQTEVMNRQSLHLVFINGQVPVPDSRRNADLQWQKLDPKMEGTVKRLIAHLKDEK